MKTFALLTLIGLVSLGCEIRSGDPFATPTADTQNQESPPEDLEQPGGTTGAETLEPDPVVVELPDDWIVGPDGFCDDPKNQTYAFNVIDGDTISISNSFEDCVVDECRIRMTGVDAPETYKNDCFSTEARDLLKTLIPTSEPICLQSDIYSTKVDPYDRLLRYVFVKQDGQWVMVNTRLIRLGVARAYHAFLKGKTYKIDIISSESRAADEHRGGWSACGW